MAGQHRRATWHAAGLPGGPGRPRDGHVWDWSVQPLWSRRRRDLLHDLHCPGRQGRWHRGPPLCVWTGTLFPSAFIHSFVLNQRE